MEKKYYKVSLNDDDNGVIWHILLNHVIDKANFFEFTGGVIKGEVPNMDITLENGKVVNLLERSRVKMAEYMWNEINTLGITDLITWFYTSRKNYMRHYAWEWGLTRLKLDKRLAQMLIASKDFLQLAGLSSNLEDFTDLSDPAFYQDNTALLFTVHEAMSAFILLDKKEKKSMEQKGVYFEESIAFNPNLDCVTQIENLIVLKEDNYDYPNK